MGDSYKIIFTTERLILRTWKASDILLMASINADPMVMEYFPSTQTLAETQEFIERNNLNYEKYGYCLYAVEVKDTHENNNFIGFVGLDQPRFAIPHFVPKALPIVEIGWRLASQHWNKGYATEAAKSVLQHAFNELKLDEIISFTVVANTKSRHVMEKIGLHHSEKDDFSHPKLSADSPLSKHVLYRLAKDKYSF